MNSPAPQPRAVGRHNPNYRCPDCGMTWPSQGVCPSCGGTLNELGHEGAVGDQFAPLGPLGARPGPHPDDDFQYPRQSERIDMEALAGMGPDLGHHHLSRRGTASVLSVFVVVAAGAAGVGALISSRGGDSGPWPRPVAAAAGHTTTITVPALHATLSLPGDFHDDPRLGLTLLHRLPNAKLQAALRQEVSAATPTQSLVVLSAPTSNGAGDVADAASGVQALNGTSSGGSLTVDIVDTYTLAVRGQSAIAVDVRYRSADGATVARQRNYFVEVSGRLVVVSVAVASAEADADLAAMDRALRQLT